MNINLDEKQKKNIEEKFLEFQRIWSLEKVRNMTLEEYTSIKKDNPDRNDFTFWIENKLDDIGSIWGGSSFKFGIYRRNDEDQKESSSGRLYSQNYAWLAKYGNTENEAFNNVKEKIIQIIQASQDNNLEAIEKIDFGDAIKWKIAFHYQNIKNIKIVDIFSRGILDLISSNKFKKKLKIYQIHYKLLENENVSLIEMIENIAIPLWHKYGMNSQSYIDKMKNLFSKYLNKKNLNQNTISQYIQALENISKEFLKGKLYSYDLFSFDQNINKLNKNEEFKSKNSNGHNIYSSALNHYRFFLIDYYEQDNFMTEEMQDEELNMKNIPLNQILYGPPGTGKTYYTIDKALEILGENLESRDRDEKKAKFDEYVKDGQIVFTTFHQSYGYEEFVEGIKPKVDKKELEYEVQSGIFKKICEKALNKEIKNKLKELEINNKTNSVWKISLGEKIRKDTEFLQKYCFENNQIRIGWWDTEKITNNPFIDNFRSMKIGDLVCVFDTINTIKAVGVVKSKVKYSKNEEFEKEYSFDSEEYQTYREVEWILKDKIIDILKLNNKILDQKTVYQLKNISVSNLIKTIKDNLKDKFIIIIDEINRGNVSKIFGELITLIEPSKRIGADEELKVTLPYSKEEFGVPQNVYILGTMNTADRSITSLDTALRRRFEFIEMMPDVSKLSNDYKDVNLQELLKAINTRIEYLLDREKTIGHAFFIGVENLEDLKKVFQNKIIPLLQEYFYNDYALISAVLNDNGMIKKCEKDDKYLQKIKNLDNVDSEKIIYNIASFDNEIWNDIKTYQAIYNDGENQSKNDKQ
ncbi:McrB family protein [Campylobacter coli]|uniref:McrB family protein n=1 Tax=Campylobacter coli TaxID=195 RepID=UPI0020C19E5A|nr:McrB family protein [Campylobacter coli]